eukprot:1161183-Pelagomonas_calceolata.AAC.2
MRIEGSNGTVKHIGDDDDDDDDHQGSVGRHRGSAIRHSCFAARDGSCNQTCMLYCIHRGRRINTTVEGGVARHRDHNRNWAAKLKVDRGNGKLVFSGNFCCKVQVCRKAVIKMHAK